MADFLHTSLVSGARSGGTHQNFWMKLISQKLESWSYRMVKISLS